NRTREGESDAEALGVRQFERTFPSLKRRGGCAVKKKARSHLFPHRRARSASAIARSLKCGQFGEIFRPEGCAGLTASFDGCALSGLRGLRPPSAPSKVASRHLIECRVLPSFSRRGICPGTTA